MSDLHLTFNSLSLVQKDMLAAILICVFMVKNAATRSKLNASYLNIKKNCLSSEHVIVIISIVVVGLGQTKYYKIDTCCFSPNYKHMTFKNKHKHWLDLSLNNAYRQ